MASKTTVSRDALCQLKITLKWSAPPIWRRVLVRRDMPLDAMHDVIQYVMGWSDSHLHEFIVGTRKNQRRFGTPRDLFFAGEAPEVLDETLHTLDDLLHGNTKKFLYCYDFGDDWIHEVVLEKKLPPDPSFTHPVCLAGENACPPEDCGGIGGFYGILEIAADPSHPEHEEILEWLCEDFDPTAFDLDEANKKLKTITLIPPS
jgi:hypothetical protein